MKAENSTRVQFDSLSSNEAYARGVTAAFLARYDPTVPQLADLKTAVSEAVTNCIVHAYPEHIGPVCMTIAVYPDREVHITITDKGIGIPNVEQAMQPLFTTGNPEERPRFAERPRKSHESHDDCPAGYHGGAGSQQHVHARRKGGHDLLPRTRL